MKLPPIDLSPITGLLKKDGYSELVNVPAKIDIKSPGKNIFAKSKLLQDWNDILRVLDTEIIPLLKKGCKASALAAPAQKLASSASTLALNASMVLSFVPGPIGIACSVINAVVCFSTGNIPGGLFELLGCIPGGKVAGKAGSKLFPKIERILSDLAQNNPLLQYTVKQSSRRIKEVSDFFEKASRKLPEYPADTGISGQFRIDMRQYTIDIHKSTGKYTTFGNTYRSMPKANLWPGMWRTH